MNDGDGGPGRRRASQATPLGEPVRAAGVVLLRPSASSGPEVALIHRARRQDWSLPKGKLDPGEPPAETARRELAEEAGVAAASWESLGSILTTPGFCDEAVRVYLARGLRDVGRPPAAHEEADLTVHWVDLGEAADMVLAGEVVNATAAAGVLAAYAVVVDGKPTRPTDSPWADRPTALLARQVRR